MGLVSTVEATNALTNLSAGQVAELQVAIDAATAAISSYCNRPLASASYDRLYDLERSRTIRLSTYPVTALHLYGGPSAAIGFTFGNGASRASVQTNVSGDPPDQAATGITLTSRTAGVDTSTTLSFATYKTLATLAAAANAVTGWTATVAPTLTDFATADLSATPGAKSALAKAAELWAFVAEVDDFDLYAESGKVVLRSGWPRAVAGTGAEYAGDVFRPWDRMWGAAPRFGQIRAVYQAGYTTVPNDLKRACILVVKALFDTEPFPGTFMMERTIEYSYQLSPDPKIIPAPARQLLHPFIRLSV